MFICLLFCLTVNLKADDIYTITDFNVSKKDKDATLARKKAMEDGQRKAFSIILERLDIDPSNNILIGDDEISQMLRSMQIKQEKITNNSYSALLTMDFSQDYVKYTLNKYKISKLSPKLNSYLLIPVLKENDKTYLFENNNRWLEPFKKLLKDSRSILLINDDSEYTKDINVKNIINKPTFSKFKKLIEFYNVNNVVLIVSDYDQLEKIINIKIHIINEYTTKNAHMDYEIEKTNTVKYGFDDASKKIIDYIINLNKSDETNINNIDDNHNKDKVLIFIPISSINEYSKSDSILKSIKNLHNLQLKTLTKNMATYSIKCSEDNLSNVIFYLKSAGFSVNEKKDGLYLYR